MSRDTSTPTGTDRTTDTDTTTLASASGTDRPTQPSLRADRRGVSEILGAILVFGLLLTLLVLVQVTAVPAWNQQIEYDHSQRVQQDILDFEDAVADVVARGSGESAVVEMGAHYPSRPFLFNPPSATGTVETVKRGPISFANTEIVGVDNYDLDDLNGGSPAMALTSALLRYQARYNAYGNAPTTYYENSLVYNWFDRNGQQIPLTDAGLISGNRITLIVLDGSLSRSQVGPLSLESVPLSAPAQPVTLTSDGGPIEITVPSHLSPAVWESEILADEPRVQAVLPGPTADTVVIRLEPGTYELRMAKVGVGDDYTAEGAHYLTKVDVDESSFTAVPSVFEAVGTGVGFPGGSTTALTVTINGKPVSATPGDFFVLSLDYDGQLLANYFVAVPQASQGGVCG